MYTGRDVVSNFPLPGKVFLNQGHTITLVAFLYSMKTPPLPDDVLKLTLDTLQLITRNLTARFSCLAAQRSLMDLVGEITNTLLADLVRQTELDPEAHVLSELVDGVANNSPIEISHPTNSPSPALSVHLEHRYFEPKTGPRVPINRHRHRPPSSGPSIHHEPRDLIVKIIETLFKILSTIAHPTCIECAKKIVQAVVDDSVAPDQTREAAANALRKVYC